MLQRLWMKIWHSKLAQCFKLLYNLLAMLIKILHDIILNGVMPLTWRQWVGRLCFYVIPTFSIIIAIVGGWDVAVEMGNWAIGLFFVVLLSSPLSQLLPKIKLLRLVASLRRELGVLSFWFVVAHLVGIFYALEIFSWEALQPLLTWNSLYLWGLLGFVGMLYLAITSNTAAVKLLKRGWKKSHVIVVYPTMIFSVIHTIMAGEGGMWIGLSLLYLGLKLGLYFKGR